MAVTERAIIESIRLWSDESGYHYDCKLCGYLCPRSFPSRPKRTRDITSHLGMCEEFEPQ